MLQRQTMICARCSNKFRLGHPTIYGGCKNYLCTLQICFLRLARNMLCEKTCGAKIFPVPSEFFYNFFDKESSNWKLFVKSLFLMWFHYFLRFLFNKLSEHETWKLILMFVFNFMITSHPKHILISICQCALHQIKRIFCIH